MILSVDWISFFFFFGHRVNSLFFEKPFKEDGVLDLILWKFCGGAADLF